MRGFSQLPLGACGAAGSRRAGFEALAVLFFVFVALEAMCWINLSFVLL